MLKTFETINWENKDVNNIEDGVYLDMPIDVYHSNKTHESASLLKKLFESLAHYKAEKNKEKRNEVFFDFGNAFEMAITDRDEFNKKVRIFDDSKRPFPDKDYKTKANRDYRNSFFENARDLGKLVIPSEGDNSSDVMNQMLENFMSHKSAETLISGSNFQTSIFWTDKKSGLQLKTRPDFWKGNSDNRKYALIADLKTDKDSLREKHLKSICNLNYPVQAIIQMMGLAAAGLIDKTSDSFNARFFWVVCSKCIPYNTEVYEFTGEDIPDFLIAVENKLMELAEAKKEDTFLSYDPSTNFGITEVRFPFYYRNSMGIYESIGSSPN